MLRLASETVEEIVTEYRAGGHTVELIGIMEGKCRRVTVLKVCGGESPVHVTVSEPVEPDPMDFPRPMGVAPYIRA